MHMIRNLLFFIFLCFVACKTHNIDEKSEQAALHAVDSAVAANIIAKNENKKSHLPKRPSHSSKNTNDSSNLGIDLAKAKKYFQKGKKHEENENYQKAISAYTEAIQADTTFAEALFQLGLVQGALDKHKESIAAYLAAIQHHYEPLADCHSNLAYQYLALSDYNSAKNNFQKAINLQENAENCIGLAISSYKLGETEVAKNAYNKAATFDKNFLSQNIRNSVSLKYLFTEKDMQVIEEVQKLVLN